MKTDFGMRILLAFPLKGLIGVARKHNRATVKLKNYYVCSMCKKVFEGEQRPNKKCDECRQKLREVLKNAKWRD